MARRFSAGFFAALLRDLGARAVVALEPLEYDPGPLEAAGLRVHTLDDLGCAPQGGGGGDGSEEAAPRVSLQVLDRFMAVMDEENSAAGGGGGLVAVHCGAERRGIAATLVAAYAVRRGLFRRPAEAAAWLWLAAPAGGGLRAELQFLELTRRRRGARSLSLQEGAVSLIPAGDAAACDSDGNPAGCAATGDGEGVAAGFLGGGVADPRRALSSAGGGVVGGGGGVSSTGPGRRASDDGGGPAQHPARASFRRSITGGGGLAGGSGEFSHSCSLLLPSRGCDGYGEDGDVASVTVIVAAAASAASADSDADGEAVEQV